MTATVVFRCDHAGCDAEQQFPLGKHDMEMEEGAFWVDNSLSCDGWTWVWEDDDTVTHRCHAHA